MKKKIAFIAIICTLVLAGCGYDNYDEPEAILSGNIMYNGENVGLRTNGARIDLYQDGYDFSTNISVYPAHDGTYSASLFEGEYKLVFRGDAPWDTSVDTLYVMVKGHTKLDLEVKPYYIVRNESFQKASGTVTAKFTVNKISDERELEAVNIYFGKSILTDQNQNEGVTGIEMSQVNIGSETTITASIPEELANRDYFFIRVALKISGIGDMYYTQIQKIEL